MNLTLTEHLYRAFKNCDLDCAQWDEGPLRELAEVATIACLEVAAGVSDQGDTA